MSAFVIEKDGEIKENFGYEILFNKTTRQSLVAYSQANYGPEAVFRHMTDEEEAEFMAPAKTVCNPVTAAVIPKTAHKITPTFSETTARR